MRYENVCLEAIACTLPDEVVTSDDIERRLAPLYQRLRLPEGRLELMTGIRQRRFWPRGMRIGPMSIASGEKALAACMVEKHQIGALVHGSVCRDFVEPATACSVHQGLQLPGKCAVYDVSNACLGLLNGTIQVANMIELGQIEAGLVVGTESGRALVENTIDQLNADDTLSRHDIKSAFASLTIGAGSAAIVLAHRKLSRSGNRLLGGVVRANTNHCHLCQGQDASGTAGVSPLMQTDSETLMREGIATAEQAFADFLAEMNWQRSDIAKTFCHQVGRAHHKLLFETIGLDQQIDFATYETLGNTGAVALPSTAALGIEQGHLQPGDRVALLGIGSGINVVMLGLQWQGKPT
jgi:3-oxoacyl-[acyl-carrier-protein] synthase-3